MPLPSNLETCIVKGKYSDFLGEPVTNGAVVLRFPVFVRDPGADTILVPFDIVCPLDSTGSFSRVIPVNNDPDADPVGWELTVKEDFPGGRTYSFPVPAGSVELDLADIANTSPVPDPGDTVYASFPALETEKADRAQGDADTLASAQAYSDAGDAELVPESSRNAANGFAGLDALGNVLGSVIPDVLGGHKTFDDTVSVVNGVDQTLLTVRGTAAVRTLPVVQYSSTTATDFVLGVGVTGEANNRFNFKAGGDLEWGDGVAAPDVGIFRTSAGNLKINGRLGSSEAAPLFDDQYTPKGYVDAADALAVLLEGAQTINGLKTFAGGAAGTTMRLTSASDASLVSTDHGFQIGDSAGGNLRMDTNEIQAVNNGAASSLGLQVDGGNLNVFITRAVGSIVDTMDVRGVLQSSTNRTIMGWTLLSTLGTFGTGFSADAANPPMMGKFVENGIEVWKYKGRFSVTTGTIPGNTTVTAFTFTNAADRPSSARGWQAFASGSEYFGLRIGLSTTGIMDVGVPSEVGNTTVGFNIDASLDDPKLSKVS